MNQKAKGGQGKHNQVLGQNIDGILLTAEAGF
jgi:hypothetical protein